MKSVVVVALVALLTVVAFAGGVYTATTVRPSEQPRPITPNGQFIVGDGLFVTSTTDAKGIIVWKIQDGIAVTARSFYVHTGPGPDGAPRNTVEEDAFTYRPSN